MKATHNGVAFVFFARTGEEADVAEMAITWNDSR
jgi:hypothetical protein